MIERHVVTLPLDTPVVFPPSCSGCGMRNDRLVTMTARPAIGAFVCGPSAWLLLATIGRRVHVAANVCPRCRRWLTTRRIAQFAGFLVLTLAVLAMLGKHLTWSWSGAACVAMAIAAMAVMPLLLVDLLLPPFLLVGRLRQRLVFAFVDEAYARAFASVNGTTLEE